jgi:hypothetical protein
MANYASLRGPVGMNRVYVPSNGRLTGDAFLAALTAGQGVATNGALLYLQAGEARLGDTARLSEAGTLDYRATLRANFPVDHLELVWNGSVVSNVPLGSNRQSADVRGSIPVQSSGWLLLRAWNDDPDPDLMDIYRYATTSPIYVWVRDQPRRSRQAGTYFLAWLDRLRSATEHNAGYRTSAERNAVLQDISRARVFYEQCRSEGH